MITKFVFWNCAVCYWLVRRFLFCSDQDPGGLLLLPEKGVSENLDISEVLSVMDTLLLVAAREVTVLALFIFLLLCCSFCMH